MNKKQLIRMSVVIIFIAILVAFVLNLLFKIHTNGLFSAEWNAGDALNYVASIFGALGTIVLGCVAYKQNDKLQELENNNYIANYSTLILVEEISIEQKIKNPINWEIHSEQIIKDSDLKTIIPGKYVGYILHFKAKYIGNSTPALLHIKDFMFFYGEGGYLLGKNCRDHYSKIAIYKDNTIGFDITYIADLGKGKEIANIFKQEVHKTFLEVQFNILTDKNVITKCKCRFRGCREDRKDKMIWKDTDPMVFFNGHSLAKKNSIKIAGEDD